MGFPSRNQWNLPEGWWKRDEIEDLRIGKNEGGLRIIPSRPKNIVNGRSAVGRRWHVPKGKGAANQLRRDALDDFTRKIRMPGRDLAAHRGGWHSSALAAQQG